MRLANLAFLDSVFSPLNFLATSAFLLVLPVIALTICFDEFGLILPFNSVVICLEILPLSKLLRLDVVPVNLSIRRVVFSLSLREGAVFDFEISFCKNV